MNLEEQQQLARDLYYQENYTQKQIGQIIGVSQKTICMWVKDKKWEYLKNSVDQTPLYMIASINRELAEINNRIANRDGRKIPYQEEANLRYKLLSTIKLLQTKQDLGSNMEVLANFVAFLKEQGNTHLAKDVLAAADEYLTGTDGKKKKKIVVTAYKPIPGQEHYLPIPAPPEPEPEIIEDNQDPDPEPELQPELQPQPITPTQSPSYAPHPQPPIAEPQPHQPTMPHPIASQPYYRPPYLHPQHPYILTPQLHTYKVLLYPPNTYHPHP